MTDSGDIERMRRIGRRVESYGVVVRWIPGWEQRGATFPVVPTRILDHHDASSRKSGEWGALGYIVDRTLSQFQVARCLDGVPKLSINAAGVCHHAGLGGPYGELPLNNANSRAYGAEKANDGLGEPYTAAANYATNALFHAVALECGRPTDTICIGHKEWAPRRKTDPTYSMADRRRQVANFRPTGASPQEDQDMTPEQARMLAELHGKVVGARFGLEGRPGAPADDLLGHVLSSRALSETILHKVGALQYITSSEDAGPAHGEVLGLLREIRALLERPPEVTLDPEAIAAGIPPELARQVADELGKRLNTA